MANDDSIWNYPIVDEVRYYVEKDIDYAYKYAIKDINEGVISLINVEEWNEDFYLLKDFVISKLKDSNYELKKIKVPDFILGDILDTIIETKRYDDLEKLSLSNNIIDNEIFDKFMIPFEMGTAYKLPSFSKRNLDVDELIQKYGFSKLPLEFLDYYEYEYDYDFFKEKLKSNPK